MRVSRAGGSCRMMVSTTFMRGFSVSHRLLSIWRSRSSIPKMKCSCTTTPLYSIGQIHDAMDACKPQFDFRIKVIIPHADTSILKKSTMRTMRRNQSEWKLSSTLQILHEGMAPPQKDCPLEARGGAETPVCN